VQQLFHRPLAAAEASILPGTEGALNSFFSPEGKWVGFWSGGELKKIPLAKLACRLLRVDGSVGAPPHHDVEAITASPHFRCLQGASQAYEDYYAQSPGVHQTDDHSVHNLRQLARDFCYLEAPHETAYIVTRYEPRSDRFIVMDGLHRAAVLASQQARDVVVAVVHDG